MRSILLLTVVAAATIWIAVRQLPTSSADAQPQVAHNQEVQSVSIDGRGLPLSALRDVLGTRRGQQLDASRLVQDRAALEATLEAGGYLAARVEPAAVNFAPSGGAYVTFQISQGPLFKLRSVTVRGAGVKDPAARDASVVTLIAGDDAIPARIESARQSLADQLSRRGKPTSVTVALHTDERAAAVDVELVAR